MSLNHTHLDSSVQVISSSQRPLPTQQTQETNTHAFSGVQTRDSRNWAATKLRLKPPASALLYNYREVLCLSRAKYCGYPGCGRHTGNVHPAACKYWQVSICVLILHLWCSSRTRQFDTWSWNMCGNSLKYTSFTVNCLYVGKTGNRTAKLWNVSELQIVT